MEIPIVKIELNGMRETIVHAFTTHELEIATNIDQQLKKAIEEFDYEGIVHKVAMEVLTDTVTRSIKAYFTYGEGYKVIEAVVQATLAKKGPEGGQNGE